MNEYIKNKILSYNIHNNAEILKPIFSYIEHNKPIFWQVKIYDNKTRYIKAVKNMSVELLKYHFKLNHWQKKEHDCWNMTL